MGASVTAGHGIRAEHGQKTYHAQFFQDFVTLFPKSKLFVGAVPATNSES